MMKPGTDPSNRVTLSIVVLGMAALTLLVMAPLVGQAMRGAFGDPDDAMRLVEVRAWLAGQSWFDVTAYRLDPPLGASMHWSRLVDLPMAGFIALFRLFAMPDCAEHLAAVAVPTLWLVALYAGIARLATILLGRDARVPALLGLFASGAVLVQMQPGRIGHHAPETVCLVFALASTLESLDPRHARKAALAAGLVALGLAMSLETMPFLGALCAAMILAWMMRGEAMDRAMAWFAGGLALFLPTAFLLTTGWDHWFAPVCDAFGAAHVGAGLIVALVLLVILRVGPVAPVPRLLATVGLGGLALLYVAIAYPACLHSPFAGVDPLVRAIWLDNVVESKPLLAFLRDRPMTGLTITIPIALGLCGAVAAACSLRGLAAARFAIVAGLAGLGLGLGFWQVRVLASVTPIALCGGLFVVARLQAALRARGIGRSAIALASVAILPFTATAWAIVLPSDPGGTPKAACLTPEALAPIRSLAPGRVLAPVDMGSHLIEAAGMDVFAAPYHRNDDGNRFALTTFLAKPADAAQALAARHVAYVMICSGIGETARLAARAPDSLAAALEAGHVPDVLAPVSLEGTPIKVFAVRMSGAETRRE